MKPRAPQSEKEFGKDMKTFEQLPARTKDLELLRHQAEKATGREGGALDTAIREKAKQAASDRPLMDKASSTPAGKS